jgi:hypothetical protein
LSVVAVLVLTAGIAVGVLWPRDDSSDARPQLSATERCLRWLSDVGAGEAELTEEQRLQVQKLVRPGAFKRGQEEDGLFQLWAIGRREPCARAARFGLVGSDGSLGPFAIEILTECFFFHNLKRLGSDDPERAERTLSKCRRIDDVIGRDPNDFG